MEGSVKTKRKKSELVSQGVAISLCRSDAPNITLRARATTRRKFYSRRENFSWREGESVKGKDLHVGQSVFGKRRVFTGKAGVEAKRAG